MFNLVNATNYLNILYSSPSCTTQSKQNIMKKNFMKAFFAVVIAAVFVSCEREAPEPSSLDELNELPEFDVRYTDVTPPDTSSVIR